MGVSFHRNSFSTIKFSLHAQGHTTMSCRHKDTPLCSERMRTHHCSCRKGDILLYSLTTDCGIYKLEQNGVISECENCNTLISGASVLFSFMVLLALVVLTYI